MAGMNPFGGLGGGSKDIGSGAASTKKSVKSSKLARMTEEEKVKYLERKMAEEEESKRRKEDMVSTFMKLKMRKEERFEALNVAKLMEQWRSLMRIAKSRDLQGDVRVLMDSFNRAIRQKSMHIQLLMQDLTESEMQYALAFRSQVESMSAVQSIHSRRVNDLLVEHEACVSEFTRRSGNEEADVDNADRFLGDVGIAMDIRHAAIVEAMRNSHQAIKDETRNKNMEERQSLHIQLEESLELLWSRLQKSSNSYKTVTEEKRRMYGELLGKDKKGVAEVVENNKKISKLMDDCQRLRDTIAEMQELEARRLSGPKKERAELMTQLKKLRRKSTAAVGSGSGGVTEDEEELRKLAVAVDNFQMAVADVSQFQRNFLHVIRTSAKYGAPGDQGRQHIRIRNTDSEDPVGPVRNMLAEANLRKAELKQELRLNSVKLNSVKNQVYRNVQELAKGPPARRPNL